MRNKVNLRLLWTALALSALAACGGGSDSPPVATGGGGGTPTVAISCPAQNVAWTVNSNACSAATGAIASGAVASLTNSASGLTGAASFTCTNGTLGAAAAATCSNVVAPQSPCPAQNVTWSQNGNACSAAAGATASAGVANVTNSAAGFTGSANFTCTNGTLGAPVAAACAAVVPPVASAPCNSSTLTWTATGNTCSGVAANTLHNSIASVANSTANVTGTASFTCTNGAFGAAGAASTCATASGPDSTPTVCVAGTKGCP
jgi:hypothetical protein